MPPAQRLLGVVVRWRPTAALLAGGGTTTPRETRHLPGQRSSCSSFGRGPPLNLKNAAGPPGKVPLKEEARAESLETVYKEAKSQGDSSHLGAVGGGDQARGQPRPGCASSLFPRGHPYLACPALTASAAHVVKGS